MDKYQVLVTPRKQEVVEPEVNLIEEIVKLPSFLENVEKKVGINIDGFKSLPLSEKLSRAEIFYEYLISAPQQRKEILKEIDQRENVYSQYLDQGEINIEITSNSKSLGVQTSRYVILGNEKSDKVPVFFVPGMSNDISSVGMFIRELALTRKVVVVAHPESNMGYVTREFANEVEKIENLALHAQYFKKAALVFLEGEFELWGYSAGGEVIFEMLNDESFSNKVSSSVVICPAASSDISKIEFYIGLLEEFSTMVAANSLKKIGTKLLSALKYDLILGKKTKDSKDQKILKHKVLKAVLERILEPSDAWKNAKVKKDGKIIVLSGTQDKITKSCERFEDLSHVRKINPQIEVINDKGGSHATPLVKPGVVIKKIEVLQKTLM